MQSRDRLWFIAAASALAAVLVLFFVFRGLISGPAKSPGPDQAEHARAPDEPPIEPLEGPWVVAVQPGHWQIQQLPQELARLRTNTGAAYGSVWEADINKSVVDTLIPKLEAEGWTVLLVPATLPPGLRADAFLSIHADSSNRTQDRGWKLAPPWRSSPASRSLAEELNGSFSEEPGLEQDADGVTINMRGYFGFNYRRFQHSISPYTPSVLIELGFISNPTERALMTTKPEYFADIILRGLKTYFKGRDRSSVAALRPMNLPWVAAGPEGAVIRRSPREDAELLQTVEAGTIVMPVDSAADWYEVFVRRHRTTGWVHKSELVSATTPRWTMPGEQYRNRSGS